MQYFSSTGTTPLPLLAPINLLALCHLSKIICVASVHPTVLVLLILTPVKLLEAPLTNKCVLEDHLQYEHSIGDDAALGNDDMKDEDDPDKTNYKEDLHDVNPNDRVVCDVLFHCNAIDFNP